MQYLPTDPAFAGTPEMFKPIPGACKFDRIAGVERIKKDVGIDEDAIAGH
jgi:hypothetical protein